MDQKIQPVEQRPKFSEAINSGTCRKLIENVLKDEARRNRFIANITSAVSINKALQECTISSILAGAFLGDSLGLVPSPQLGQFYLVPFKNTVKRNGKTVYKTDANGNNLKDERGRWIPETVSEAVFVLGYKGYIQLAIRSGNYRSINVVEVKEGEFGGFNPFTEELIAHWIIDPAKRATAKTIGYAARFEYLNGFSKILFWTKEQMLIHADTYSPAFNAEDYIRLQNGEISENEMWKYSSFWYKNFDGMAKKTMIRQLISHWGEMSTDMQTIATMDNQVVKMTEEGQIDLSPEDYPVREELEGGQIDRIGGLQESSEEPASMEVPDMEVQEQTKQEKVKTLDMNAL